MKPTSQSNFLDSVVNNTKPVDEASRAPIVVGGPVIRQMEQRRKAVALTCPADSVPPVSNTPTFKKRGSK